MRKSSTKSLIWGGATVRRLATPLLLAVLFSSYAVADGGSETYKAKCSACHGVKGAGDTMIGKNLNLRSLASPDVQSQSDDELFTVIGQGKRKMPSFNRKLSPDQIRGVVRHIRSLNK